MNPEKDQALIIGDGAMGMALGAMFGACGLSVGFVGRGGPVAVRAEVRAPLGPTAAPFFPGADQTTLLETTAPDLAHPRIAVVAVVVKAFDLAAALRWTERLARRPGATSPISVWSLSNGAVEAVVAAGAEQRPDLLWRLGYCTFGVSVDAPRVYSWRSSTGDLVFGPLPGAAAPLGKVATLTAVEQKILAQARFCQWHAPVEWWHRRKWLVNTVLNTLAAARRAPTNGEILADLPMVAAVFSEAYQLGRELWGEWPFSQAELYSGLLKIATATAANENSMARDVRLGRPTESAFLAGLAAGRPQYPLLVSLHDLVSKAAVNAPTAATGERRH